MSRKKPTDGYEMRLQEAREHGPRPMSVRELARRAQEKYPDRRGTSYGGVRQYATPGGVKNPRVDLLRALADVLGVRPEWLAYGDGMMTPEQELAVNATASDRAALQDEVLSNAESAVYAAMVAELPRMAGGLVRTQTRIVGLIEQLIGRPDFLLRQTPSFRSHAADEHPVGARAYGLERDLKVAAVQELAAAIRKPADVLGVSLDKLSESHFDLYVDAMSTALGVLLTKPERLLPGGHTLIDKGGR